MAERVRQEFDEYASDYEAVINDYVRFSGQSQDFFTRGKAHHLRQILREKARGAARTIDVLDVGCGHGLIHPHLRGGNHRLTGVDVAEDAIAMARRTNPDVVYEVYDGKQLPYADASYDVLFTICVMHHVPVGQWNFFVEEARRVLRPGGIFVVFEHNGLNPLVRWIVARIPFDRNAVLLSSWRTKSLLNDAGFRDILSRYILFFPFEGGIFHKFESCLTWLPMGAQYYVAGTK